MSRRITSMTRSRFLQLWREARDGALKKRWPKGKTAATKAEEVEARQLTMMSYLIQDVPDTFDKLLHSEDWNEVEFVRAEDGRVTVRAKRKACPAPRRC